ncbi:MAG TPA: histidine kinase dimerization/phospho-acceptor domain-containing protein [Blastocatellia bacterium]|nr:histidine kinase dimerization/phospho-acceptor domain-containing protein [Blastocatellia bacterium]
MDTTNQNNTSWLCVLDFLDEEVSIHSADGLILFANRRLLESSGGAAVEWLGRRCDEVFAAGCPHEEALKSKTSAQTEAESREPGKTRTVTVVPLLGANGEAEGYARISAASPVTPSQEALLKAEHFATLGQMMSGIAHDVGTPLNIISGYAEYLLMRTKGEGTGHKELTAILEQTRRVAEYIRIMLDLARPSQGRVDAIELKGFLGDSLELMGSHLRKASIRVALACKSAPPVIYGDGPRLRQAFFNLLLNAGRRLGAGGQLDLSIEEPPEMPGFIGVRLTGVDREGRAQDFAESFAGFLRPRRNWGTEEMGLMLTKGILDEYGAQVTALPIEGQGVALLIYLPKRAGSLATGRPALR